jgi:hypothetical protein
MAARDTTDAPPPGVVVIGLFPDPDAAAQAIRQLQDAGFTKDEIGAIMPKRGPGGEPLAELVEGEDLEVEADATKTGAATGGIVGGLLGLVGSLLVPGLGAVTLGGVLASTLLGAGVGAVTGGLLGMLVGMGASQAEAEYFDRAVRTGRGTLVTVQPGADRAAEARSIMGRAGADLGPSARATAGAGASAGAGSRTGQATETWRGAERRNRQDVSFGGPERRHVRV